jgi:methylamine utilization protein MauE
MDRRLVATWWTLKIALGAAPLLAGLDKFFNLLTNWTDYLNPMVLQYVPLDAEVLMRGVGIVEMIVGLAILTRWTRLGAWLAALWFVAIAINLVSMQRYYDIAVRDLLLAVSAFTLARLTAVRQAEQVESHGMVWETSPREILTLKL